MCAVGKVVASISSSSRYLSVDGVKGVNSSVDAFTDSAAIRGIGELCN